MLGERKQAMFRDKVRLRSPHYLGEWSSQVITHYKVRRGLWSPLRKNIKALPEETLRGVYKAINKLM